MYYCSEYKDRPTSTMYAVNTKPYTINLFFKKILDFFYS